MPVSRRLVPFFILVFFGVGLMAGGVEAQVDQKCWVKEECNKVRAELGAGDSGGLYAGADAQKACGVDATKGKNAADKEVGFCLPVGQSTTKISFGGKQSFANFGEFIQYMYRYGMWIAGIIAVALIVISGAQWAASGGNADMIGSAKTRIGGAVTGLVLLSLSYVILNTINPYLVTLRLPQVWLINEQGMAPPFCSDVEGKKVALLSPSTLDPAEKQKKKEAVLKKANSSGYDIEPASAVCGNDYIVEGTGGQACQGQGCGSGNICGDVVKDDKLTSNKMCYLGDLIVKYSASLTEQAWSKLPLVGLATAQLDDDDWIDINNEALVYGICTQVSDNTSTGGSVCPWPADKSVKVGGYRIKDTLITAYYFVYQGLRDLTAKELCPEGSSLVGIMIKEEIDKNWNLDLVDPNIYLAIPKYGNQAYFGDFQSVFNQVKAEASDVLTSRLAKGNLKLNAVLDTSILSKISSNQWSSGKNIPSEDLCFKKSTVPIPASAQTDS